MTSREFPSVDLSHGFGGRLIIAMPSLEDSPFSHSVVLMCSHDDEHAFGVIVNKPVHGLTVAEVLSEMDIDGSENANDVAVFFGGPVDMERGAVLHSLDYRSDDTVVVADGIGLTASRAILEAICQPGCAPRDAMLIMGHAGWSAGQLDDEVKRNAWLSAPIEPELVFGDWKASWRGALGTLGIVDPAVLSGDEDFVARPN